MWEQRPNAVCERRTHRRFNLQRYTLEFGLNVDCGRILISNLLYEGDWTRNFEGEEDTSQRGEAFNPYMFPL